MQKPWSLYNKEDKLRVDDLTSEQVRVVILSTATSRMNHWYACQEGDVHWQPISAIQEFYEDVRQIKGAPPEEAQAPQAQPAAAEPVQKPIARRPLFEDAPIDQKTQPTLQVENVSTKERRTARRYPRKLIFKLESEGRVFTCDTKDVSMSGLSLDQDLPAWAAKTFHAELKLNNTVVRILCAKVDSQSLKIKESSSWDVIRAWIVNW